MSEQPRTASSNRVTHTPGPWHVSDLDRHIVGPRRTLRDCHSGTQIGQLLGVARVMERLDETEANARLIAAAPDLLAALSGLLVWVCGSDEYADTELANRCEAARAAIAKAEGR